MTQLGFGSEINTTVMESGYDQYQKKEDFEFIPISIILVAIIVVIIIYKKGISPPEDNKSLNIDNFHLTDENKQSFFSKKVTNENIKLLHQNLLAMVFLKSGYKETSNFRALADIQGMWTQTNAALENFLQRDLTKEEIKIEFDTNMFVRRAYDELKVTASLGKFDKVINPEYDGNGSWETIIDEYKEGMKWTER